jgi:pimeloyl-ACP methyl ester carboxylesterase
VLLIPGFLSRNGSLDKLAEALARSGHTPAFAGVGLNVDCSEATAERLATRLQRVVRARGAPIALVGHSRGGLLARVLAVRHPDLVATVVTLGSPHRDQLAIHPVLWATAFGLALAARLGAQGVVRHGCAGGSCCRSFDADLAAPLSPRSHFVSIYSRRDGIVDWRACLDSEAHHVEVPVPHLALTHAPAALDAVCDALAAQRSAIAWPPSRRRHPDCPLRAVASHDHRRPRMRRDSA